MRAISITSFGGPEVLTLTTLTRPEPRPGQVLIKVDAVSVNFSDTIRRANGPCPFPAALPFTPGSEIAGTVDALGAGVAGPAVGTPVFALAGTGHAAGSTGYAQFALADAPTVAPIPPGMSTDQACTILVAGVTALLALSEAARVAAGRGYLTFARKNATVRSHARVAATWSKRGVVLLLKPCCVPAYR